MEIITSTSNEKIIKYSKLNQKKYRDEYSLFLLENYKLINEAKNRNEDIECIIIREDMKDKYAEIIKTFDNIIIVSSSVFSKISDTITSQGIIAVIKKPLQKSIENINGKTLVLDRIQDAGNMGTLMRSALGFGFKNLVLINSVDPYNPKVIRSCGGSIFLLNIIEIQENALIFHAKNNKIAVFVADMQGKDLYTFDSFPDNLMVIVGNEGQGVSKALEEAATDNIKIPMSENLESLNAGVSGSIIMSFIHSKQM